MRCLIVSNGQITDYNYYENIVNKVDYIICVDGGAKHLIRMNITPDVLIGDLDSISSEDKEKLTSSNVELIKFNVDKDATDTELAMDFAISKGVSEIIFIGVTGTRLDHTLSNIYLLKKLLEKNIEGKIINEHNEIILINKKTTIRGKVGDLVSIIPITQRVNGVSLNGFKFHLYNATLGLGTSLGISNVLIDEIGTINIENGLLLVIKSRD